MEGAFDWLPIRSLPFLNGDERFGEGLLRRGVLLTTRGFRFIVSLPVTRQSYQRARPPSSIIIISVYLARRRFRVIGETEAISSASPHKYIFHGNGYGIFYSHDRSIFSYLFIAYYLIQQPRTKTGRNNFKLGPKRPKAAYSSRRIPIKPSVLMVPWRNHHHSSRTICHCGDYSRHWVDRSIDRSSQVR